MDDRPSSLPLTIKSSCVATLLTQPPRKGRSLTPLLRLSISRSRFSPPHLGRKPRVKPERNKKEIKNEAAIKHMDHADSWFSVVRADYPGRTDSIEE